MRSTSKLHQFVKSWEPGGRSFVMSDRTWGLPEVVAATLKKTGPATVDVCTYSTGVETVNDCMHAVKSGRALGFRFLIHNRMVASRTGRGWASILRRVGAENIRAGHTHAKFAIIEAPGWAVSIVTSGNMNANRALETFAWEEGADRPTIATLREHFDEAFRILPELQPPTTALRNDRRAEGKARQASRQPKRKALDDLLGDLP